MKKLSIQLNEEYRSFKSGFSCIFEGDLIILSGINGSGKSQLIDIISQREGHGSKKIISANIDLNGQRITRNDILRRSFKENISVPELTHAGTESVVNHRNQAWNAYHQYRLDYNNESLWDYKESSERARKILVEKFGEQKFSSGQISETEFKFVLPAEFVWKSDDIFTNFIGELFFNYAIDVYDAKAQAGETGDKFNSTNLPIPPWKQLNDLFSELGFEYRFKDNYYIINLQINEQPYLYQTKSDGFIDEHESRKLADLSDGEKAIISLSFASLSGVIQEQRKVLLLDEFDANFNPSLTEVFYKILDRYFISQDILVVIATHSATTISLALDYAFFYEVFKKNVTSSTRILPVQKDDYAELKVANKTFYGKIADQASRIAELEKEKTEGEAKLDELRLLGKPSLFLEGDLDVQYLNKATSFYPEWRQILDMMEVKEANGKGDLSKYWKSKSQIKEFLRHPVILFFDCDTKQLDEDDPPVYKRRVPVQESNSIKVGIENLFADSLITKAESAGGKKYVQRSIPDTDHQSKQEWRLIEEEKKNFADWICANGQKEDFINFTVIFDQIKVILGV